MEAVGEFASKPGGQVMAKTIRPVMDIPAFITNWLDKGKTFEEITMRMKSQMLRPVSD